MKKLMSILLVLLIAVCFSKIAFAAEHPGEHPGEAVEHKEQEHPGEHSGMAISAERIRRAIEAYSQKEARLKGGYFLLYDPKDRKLLQLDFVRVHDRVSYIKNEDVYFACADFKTSDGKTPYDLDFWLKKGHMGDLEVTKVMVHKKADKARFTYSDDEIVPVEESHMHMAPEGHTGHMAPEEPTGYMAPEEHS